MKTLFICTATLAICLFHRQDNMKEISKNQMTVKWKIEQGLILFEMQAPTDGWIAIGLNETSSLAGTYLLMGRVVNGTPEVVEHYTTKPGVYKPIAQYDVASNISLLTGNESGKFTTLKFAIPVKAASRYHKELYTDTQWTLLMAYSLDDDFLHHSIMRTSVNITL